MNNQSFNPSHANGLFLYPLKTSEYQRFSDVFRRYRKRPVAWNRLIKYLEQLKVMHAKLNSLSIRKGVFRTLSNIFDGAFFPQKKLHHRFWKIHWHNAKDPVTCWANNTSTFETRSNFIWRCFVVLTVNYGPNKDFVIFLDWCKAGTLHEKTI